MEENLKVGKIILIGNSSVGKSCLFNRFIDRQFKEHITMTVGVDYRIKNLEINSQHLKLLIFDTSGQEKFFSMSKNFYRRSHGVMIVFSLGDRESFEKVKYWVGKTKEDAPEFAKFILVGNKSDMHERAVEFSEASNLAKELQVPYIETSAKTGDGVDEAFMNMAEIVLKVIDDNKGGRGANESLIVQRKPETSKGCRC